MKNKTLKVKEIFYSIQGEGARQGEASIFIRLAGCNMNCSFCDTDWKDGKEMTIEEIIQEIFHFPCRWIVWTGGEPTLQLTEEILMKFPCNYMHAIETNGSNPVPKRIDYIACSPKVDVKTLSKNFNWIDEIRYAYDLNSAPIPLIKKLPNAKHHYISPIFIGKNKKEICKINIETCIRFVKTHPEWKLSIQLHKLINIR